MSLSKCDGANRLKIPRSKHALCCRGSYIRRVDGQRLMRHIVAMELKTKVVGKRRRPVDAVSCHMRALALIRQADKLSPFPRPRGFVFKARTWEEYEAWRKAQTNPRLW
jgi:hypothetical protein